MYTVKKVSGFPVPSRDVTNQTLPGRELLNYSRSRGVWKETSRLGTGKQLTSFLQCTSSVYFSHPAVHTSMLPLLQKPNS
jgi:hypothetical protein